MNAGEPPRPAVGSPRDHHEVALAQRRPPRMRRRMRAVGLLEQRPVGHPVSTPAGEKTTKCPPRPPRRVALDFPTGARSRFPPSRVKRQRPPRLAAVSVRSDVNRLVMLRARGSWPGPWSSRWSSRSPTGPPRSRSRRAGARGGWRTARWSLRFGAPVEVAAKAWASSVSTALARRERSVVSWSASLGAAGVLRGWRAARFRVFARAAPGQQ